MLPLRRIFHSSPYFDLAICSYKYGSDYEKTPFYGFFAASPGTLMSTLPNHAHAVKRKAQSPAFAMGLLVSLEQYVDTCLDDLLELLEKRLALAAKEGKDRATIEMSETLQLVSQRLL